MKKVLILLLKELSNKQWTTLEALGMVVIALTFNQLFWLPMEHDLIWKSLVIFSMVVISVVATALSNGCRYTLRRIKKSDSSTTA